MHIIYYVKFINTIPNLLFAIALFCDAKNVNWTNPLVLSLSFLCIKANLYVAVICNINFKMIYVYIPGKI